jgi:hypothetical protein
VKDQTPDGDTAPDQIVTELRALEWELSEVVRRVEALRSQVRDLSERLAPDSRAESP